MNSFREPQRCRVKRHGLNPALQGRERVNAALFQPCQLCRTVRALVITPHRLYRLRDHHAGPPVSPQDVPAWILVSRRGCLGADGYQRVRPLRDNDLAALPWFTIVGNISTLKFHLVDKPMFAGTESVAEGWAERILIDLRAAAKDLIQHS
jgi:hypothetical protein